MIKFEEFKYLVENATNIFKRGSEIDNKYIYYEDIAWDYARGILNDTLDKNKQDLYLKLIIKLNKKYQICFPNIIYNSIGNGNVPDEKSEAILLFLMDWNHPRFTSQENLEEYTNRTLRVIQTILQNIDDIDDIRNKSSKKAFEKVRDNISVNINVLTGKKELEHVSAAKILMLINPDRFIAWDRQIAERFALSSSNHEHYGIFNDLINNFIDRNNAIIKCIENYAKNYMRINNYIDNDSYKIRKLLDMIFWIEYNTNHDSSQFHSYVEKLKDSIS